MKNTMTYNDIMEGLRNKIANCKQEIKELKEEKKEVMFDYGVDGKEYDEWIEEQHIEIRRLHQMIHNLQEIYREVR